MPLTCEITSAGIKYDSSKNGQLSIGVASRPKSVQLNGVPMKNIIYDSGRKAVILKVEAGEGSIMIK
ncbi:MAG TPA: hypothetical protein VIJ75_18150 [Hanamia sp.]